MNNELPETVDAPALFYDALCPTCLALASFARPTLHRKHIAIAPLQSPAAIRILPVHHRTVDEMIFIDIDGSIHGGARALLQISRRYPWTWPFRQLARIPIVFTTLDAIYRWVARHRGCNNATCKSRPAGGRRQRIRRTFLEWP